MTQTDSKSATMFDGAHEAGMKRHSRSWYAATRAAVPVIRGHGYDVTDKRLAAMVSEIVLRVLDVVEGVPDDSDGRNLDAVLNTPLAACLGTSRTVATAGRSALPLPQQAAPLCPAILHACSGRSPIALSPLAFDVAGVAVAVPPPTDLD